MSSGFKYWFLDVHVVVLIIIVIVIVTDFDKH
jgi:hypothetical protein